MKRKIDKVDNIVHYNLGQILASGGKNNFRRGLYLLKNSTGFVAKYQTINKLSKISTFYNQYIYGNPIPQSIETIGVSHKTFFTEDLDLEVEWLFLTARKYRTELKLFLNYKKEFENNFLRGNYKIALDLVEKVETYIGHSLWSLTSKLLVYEYTGSQDKAKLLQSEVLEKNENGAFTASLINFISQRCERNLSAYRYDNDVKNSLSNTKSKIKQSNQDYYNFQLNFFEKKEYQNIKDVICFDYSNSIIDRYITFRKIMIYCFSNEIDIANLFEKITYLNRIINDDIFGTVNLFLNKDFKSNSFFDTDYLKIIDLYYSGLYDECISEIRKYITAHDIDFNLINLYSRSLVLSNKQFLQLFVIPCVINEVAECIYKICKRNSNPTESLYRLYQISKNIDFFDINYQLNTYIKLEQNLKCNRNYFYMALKTANPIVADLFQEKPENIQYILNKIKSATFNSVAINYKLRSLDGNYESTEGISNNKIEIDKAKYLYSKKDYEGSLLLWQNIRKENSDIPPILEIAVDYIFRILYLLNTYDDCIQLYVNSFLNNPFLVYKINTQHIRNALKRARFKNATINIYLPIFISLVSNDENEKAFIIEIYCKNNGVKLPSELFQHPEFEKNKLTELFFSYSCSNETLNYYRHLNTTRKRLDERINICNYLTIYFEESSENYSQELNLLTNELIIHEGTQKLDQSKIYANDHAILNKELDEYEGLYNRYITLAGLFLRNIKILTINKNELRYLDKKGEMEYSQSEIEYSKNADLDTFYSLFSVIRERFLFSKFGIVTYLSTRIRHGVLLGEIRPELEKNNLIFFKNKLKDRYEPNSFWISNRLLTSDERSKLTNIITDFSAKIDALIDLIIKENIQIKLNDEYEQGWFDYEFSLDELSDFAITLFYEENYKAFCKKVLDILWIRTDSNLDKIRVILHDEIKMKFVNLINEFDSDLNKILERNKMPEIFTALTACSTNLQNKIDKIADWFKRSGKVHIDFNLQTLISIICKNVQRAHPLKYVNITIKNEFNHVIKGEFYEHFNDFIRIFVENIFRHTTGNNVNCNIEVKEDKENIVIMLENDSISPDSEIPYEDFGAVGIKIDGFKLITEGRSGFMKARKIVKDDLKNQENDIYLKPGDGMFRVNIYLNFLQLLV